MLDEFYQIHSTSDGTNGSPLIIGNVHGHGNDDDIDVIRVRKRSDNICT